MGTVCVVPRRNIVTMVLMTFAVAVMQRAVQMASGLFVGIRSFVLNSKHVMTEISVSVMVVRLIALEWTIFAVIQSSSVVSSATPAVHRYWILLPLAGAIQRAIGARWTLVARAPSLLLVLN